MQVSLAKLLLLPLSLLLLAAMPWQPDSPKLERHCSSLSVFRNGTSSYWKYDYDENLQLSRIRIYEGRDERGELKRSFAVSWDSAARTETRLELGRSGKLTGSGYILFRDEENRIVEKHSLWKGEVRGRESWTYNEDGLLVRHRKSETGEEGWDYGSDFEYDARGRVIVESYGLLPHQFPFRQWRVRYSPDGSSAEVVRSRTSDGKIHSREQLFFDSAGRLVREEAPSTVVGDRLSITLWSYDEAGRLIAVEYLNERNISRERVTYTYDDEGRLLQKLSFFNGSSEPTFSNAWDYGCWSAQS